MIVSIYQRKPIPHYLALDTDTMVVSEIISKSRKKGMSLRFPIIEIAVATIEKEDFLRRIGDHQAYHPVQCNCEHLVRSKTKVQQAFDYVCEKLGLQSIFEKQ
jgi:hypothetical protein